MRSKELDEAIATLSRLLSSSGSELVQERRFRKALHELKALRKGGRVEPRRVARIVGLVAEIVCDEFLK